VAIPAPGSGWQATDLLFSQAPQPSGMVGADVQQQQQAAEWVFRQGLAAGPNALDQLALLMALDQKKHAPGAPAA
jgi:hypothetical protein